MSIGIETERHEKNNIAELKAELVLCLIAFFVPVCQCLSQNSFQGPNNPATAIESSFGCLACPGSEWLSPPNVMTPDGQYAKTGLSQYLFCFESECYYSRALIAQNFGFAIPSNSIISGIKAEVLRKAIVDSINDLQVMLLQNGDTVGMNKARAPFWSTTLLVYAPYGDSTDLWGVNWTPQQIDTSAFGLSVKVQNNRTTAGIDTAYIDHIRITVYYQTPTGVTEHQSSDDNFSVFFNHQERAIIIKSGAYSSPVYEINIYSTLGKKVYNKSFANSGMASTAEIRYLNLAEGVYLVELRGGASSCCRKLLVTQ